MSALFNAMSTATGLTENGCPTHLSSLDANLDLFSMAGSSRGKDLSLQFAKALGANKDVAIRTMLWMRDVRRGAGERQQFKSLVSTLLPFCSDADMVGVINKIPELGRFDDLEAFFNTPYSQVACGVWLNAIKDGNMLAAKWASVKDKRGAKPLRKLAGMNEHQWRKYIVEKRSTVEQKMCSGDWEGIVFNHVPSVAAARYQKAFLKHQPERYGQYKKDLEDGKAKVNATAVYPYDVVKSLNNGDETVANAQWKALPNYMEGNSENILAVVDVSGSMRCPAGGNNSITCKDVAISLGMYIAERSRGVFQDHFISFSGRPSFHKISGNLKQRYMQVDRSGEDMNTNILGVFERILSAAVHENIPKEEMPSKVIILSDMEFDSPMSGCGYSNKTTMFEAIAKAFKDHGLEMPQLVFWNLNARPGNFPVQKHACGAVMVSGFSPAILKGLLGGKDFNPIQIMLDTVMVDRYNYEQQASV